MSKEALLTELTKVAHEAKSIDPNLSDDIHKIAKDLASFIPDDQLDSINKQADLEKEAKLINEGDIVVCVDNFNNLFKGRRYLVSDASMPGYLWIRELESNGGGDVGIFAVNRFVLDNNEQ